MSRLQRFLFRVRGTQRVIFFLILAYDVYIYIPFVRIGLWWLVAAVMLGGIMAGTIAAALLKKRPATLERLVNVVGMLVMGVFLVSVCFEMLFPLWVYLICHVLLWFWFTAYFWYASRPLDADLEFAKDEVE